MKKHLSPYAFALAIFGAAMTGNAAAADVSSSRVERAFLTAEHINIKGKLVSGTQVHDRNGEHLLVLSRVVGPVQEDEHAEIRAAYYSKVDEKWSQDWQIYDFIDCHGLDFDADFLPNTTMITDLKGDGIAQVTVAYKLVCRGDVSADLLKVIMRRGEEKLAMRGEVEGEIDKESRDMGAPIPDKALAQPQNAAYKRHLESAWKIAVTNYRKHFSQP